MTDHIQTAFAFPAICGKKVRAAFDGGRLTSDAGVMVLAQAERGLGLAERLAGCIADPRDPTRTTHAISDILRARILAIACGYEDGNDLDTLRSDPGFKLACGRLPDSGTDLCSQPTVSRWENAPALREIIRLMRAMVDIYCESYASPPEAVTLDIDDTVDVVHGHQQLSLFNAYYNERCFLPIHVYDTAVGRPVAMILRPGKTPSGKEVRGHLRRLVRRIRKHWPTTRITIRGDSHYGRPQVMDWCEENSIDFVLGLAGNKVLARCVEETADDIRRRWTEMLEGEKEKLLAMESEIQKRVVGQDEAVRGFAETRYAAAAWKREWRVVARIEPTPLGLDIRYVVTNLADNTPEQVYADLYCPRGQAENLIKLHKSQLASDRTSCRAPLANQMRLILHTAAYWLLLTMRDAIPKKNPLRVAEFNTLRLRLVKIAGRIIETASRVRIALASPCPDAGLFRTLALSLLPSGP